MFDKKSLVLISALVISVFIISMYVFGNGSSDTESAPLSSSQVHNNEESSRALSNSRTGQDATLGRHLSEENERLSDDENSEDNANEQFLMSEFFTTPEKLSREFMPEDGMVSERSVVNVFQYQNFDDVVNKVRDVGYDETSLAREAALSNTLLDKFGSDIYQSNHACSGIVCALSFKSNQSISENTLSELADFDSNYSFSSTSTNDFGETVVHAIYLATDDPSNMTLISD